MALIKSPVYDVTPTLERAEGPAPMLDRAACAALLSAIGGRAVDGTPPEDSVWYVHATRNQIPLARAIAASDADALGRELTALHEGPLVKGFDQAGPETRTIDGDPMQRLAQARRIYHALIRLAVGLGLARAWNPEQAGNFPYMTEDATEDTVTAIGAALGLPPRFPVSAAGSWGLRTPFGLLSYRQVQTLGYLREVQAHLARVDRDYGHVVEIGGGLGRMAFNLSQTSGRPVTVIDLPLVGVLQYAFLTANGVPATLWPGRLDRRAGHVNIVSAFDTEPVRALSGALFVNFDGLVEMARDTQDIYFDLIARTGSDLLSVNHEAARVTGQGSVQEWNIARIAALGLDAGPRTPFFEREGYIAQAFLSPRRRGVLDRLTGG